MCVDLHLGGWHYYLTGQTAEVPFWVFALCRFLGEGEVRTRQLAGWEERRAGVTSRQGGAGHCRMGQGARPGPRRHPLWFVVTELK